MKFIGNLFAPRWKHKNPQVRKQALLALDKAHQDTQKILLEVANNDPEVFIRRFAIKRLTDIDAVQALRQSAPREEIYQDATWRLCVLLSAEDGTASIEQIKVRLDQYAETRILEYVAKHATNLQLQKYALDKIEHENIVVEVITGTENEEIRQYALDKLNSANALKRVIKSLKRKDKQLAAHAQEKLEQINAALAHHNELVNQYKQTGNDFLKLVALCGLSNEWTKNEARLRSLHEQWRGLGVQLDTQTKAHEHEQAEQVEKAFSEFEQELKRSASKEAWEVSPEVTHADVIDKLQAVNLDLADKVLQLAQQDSQHVVDQAELEQFCKFIRREWKTYFSEIMAEAGAALPLSDLPQMKAEFEANIAKLEQLRIDLPALGSYHAQLKELLADAGQLLSSEQGLFPKDVGRLEKRFAQLSLPGHLKADSQLIEDWNKALHELRQILIKQDEQRDNIVNEFAALTKQLADKISAGRSKPASQLINRGKNLLKELDAKGKSVLEKNGQLSRFNQLTQQLSELQDWRQWSSAPVKEQQISEMQVLAQELESNRNNPDYDFVSAANAIKSARKDWKSLTTGEPGGDQELWEQFDAACNQAYAICQEYFDRQAEQRTENRQKREQVCEELEAYQQKVASQEAEEIDWKAMQKIIHTARKDWGQLGVVNRGDRTKINKRYNHVLHALEKMLRTQQQKNRETKELLIKRVQHLAKQLAEQALSIEQAIESVKQIQAEWKTIGSAVKESQLWQQFRGACDSVFQAQRAEQDAINQAREAEKYQREKLIEAVEAAVKQEGEAILQARSRVEEVKAEWSELPRLKKDHALDRRFSRACQQYQKQLAQLHVQQLREEKQKLQQNVALCYELENSLFACLQGNLNVDSLQDTIADLQQRWSPVDSRLRTIDQAVKQRFETLTNCAEQCSHGKLDQVLTQLNTDESSCAKSKDLLCIQMELLAGVESPAESKQRRMEYQVAQLADKMKQSRDQNIDKEIEQLLSQWHRSGFMDPAKAQPLEQRFYSVLQSLDKDYQYNT
jgi:exonuclease SbcC